MTDLIAVGRVGLLAIGLVAIGACAYRPTAVFERVIQTEGSSVVDLSNKLRSATESIRHDTALGFVEVRFPQHFSGASAESVAQDHLAFFPIASAILGSDGSANVVVYILPVDNIPPSYMIRAVRRGIQWDRTRILYLLTTSELHSAEYWHQVGVNIHEMTHSFLRATFPTWRLDSPMVRWFEDGTCDLLAGAYLKRQASRYYGESGWRDFAVVDDSAFNLGVFDWDEASSDLSYQQGTQESDRYAVAYHIVRYIYELDDGASLRNLHRAMLERTPRTPEALSTLLKEILAIDPPTLLERARAHAVADTCG